ncbi:LLM class flavin-dependent oxidoreductase [Amycolatopsis sp. FDAARGOS 1241]|uniref:LLM class flavin-dependent oxidoreductase n=1 Tax=Amycolatopsis sp. FDAARGOS 1241 TaxID=2778070 RepID=UPI00351CA4F6
MWSAGAPADLVDVDELLEATSTLVIGTSIVTIWGGEPGVAAAAYHRVTERFPGRFWLGVGAGHREHTPAYRKTLAAMNAYLDALDAAGVPVAGRAIAALGPKMLALTAEWAGGAVPYLVPPVHTKLAREALGPAAVPAPEMKVVLDPGPVRAWDTARRGSKTRRSAWSATPPTCAASASPTTTSPAKAATGSSTPSSRTVGRRPSPRGRPNTTPRARTTSRSR